MGSTGSLLFGDPRPTIGHLQIHLGSNLVTNLVPDHFFPPRDSDSCHVSVECCQLVPGNGTHGDDIWKGTVMAGGYRVLC